MPRSLHVLPGFANRADRGVWPRLKSAPGRVPRARQLTAAASRMHTESMGPSACRFGDFVLDRATRELWRGEERVALPAKAFDCIVYLLDQRERAVGRDELIAAVWGRVDVSDSVLSQTVLYARRALDDTGREQQVIRTVVGFGYHWVAPVEIVAADPAKRVDHSANEDAPTPATSVAQVGATQSGADDRLRRRRIGAVLGCVLIAAILGAAWFATGSRAPHSGPAMMRTGGALIVLPLEVAGERSAAWMRLGVMDLVAERLREAGQAVVPSDHAVQFAQAFDTADAEDLAALASAASVAIVLAPRAQWTDGAWRVRLEATFGREPGFAATASSDELLDAARAAADAMARRLGLRPPAPLARVGDGERPLRELFQQIEAATLEDRLDDARTLIERATPTQRDLPEMRFRLAKIDVQAGRLDAAQAALANLADRVSARDDAVLRARILVAFGSIATRRGQAEAGEADLDEAIELLRTAGAGMRLGKAYAERAAARIALHHDEAALEDFAAARIALESVGDSVSLAFLDSNLGAFAMLRDRYAEAVPVFERAAQRFALLRIPSAELNARDAIVQAQLILLDPVAASRSAAPLQTLAKRVANPESRRAANLTRVEVLIASGSLDAANALLDATRASAPETPTSVTRGRTDAIRARLLFAEGDMVGAVQAAQSAGAALTRGDDQRLRVHNWLTLVRAELAVGHNDDAAASAARIAAEVATGNPAARLYATLVEAESASASDPVRARAAFERALAAADAGRVPLDLLEVAKDYAPWLLRHHDTVEASAVIERIAAWTRQDYEAALLQLRLYHALGQRDAWQAALVRTRALAGERKLPDDLVIAP